MNNSQNSPATDSPITVVYHRTDFDGEFCREIAKKFLPPDTVFIGWNHGDKPLEIPKEGMIYVMDLPVDTVFGLEANPGGLAFKDGTYWNTVTERVIWIDHHISAIKTHPTDIPGYRIDGVAACRLAYQWFLNQPGIVGITDQLNYELPTLEDYKERKVPEPYAVTLAGEYDIWDHKPSNYDDEAFQFGLRARKLTEQDWADLLAETPYRASIVEDFLQDGRKIKAFIEIQDAERVRDIGFIVEFEGLKFLAMNSPFRGSQQFRSRDIPETGHDALLKFNWTGEVWDISLYHSEHRKDIDLSVIAKKHGGGGHAGACGMRPKVLPWTAPSNFKDRVRVEKEELDVKRAALTTFIGLSEIYKRLPEQEKSRLNRQLEVMTLYSNILGERFQAFS